MDTYKGTINEFVDWLTGNDSFTNRNVSGGLPISGGSIRELLQERLRHPIIVYDDEEAGLYRLFGSDVAKNRWISLNNPQDPNYNPELAEELKLEIFNFERPSEFVLGTDLSSDPRYIIKGNTESEAAKLSFKVSLKDKEGQTKSDGIVVTYTITNNITGISKTISEPYNTSYVNNNDNPIVFNIYDYLLEGINSVNVNIKANTISNSIDVGFSIYLISFSLSSTFDFNLAKTIGNDIDVPFEINRSSVVSGSTLKVKVYIDGSLAKLANNNADAEWSTIDTSSRINNSIKIKNIYEASSLENPHILHTLRLEAEMVSGNTTFLSNIVYFTFEAASEVKDIVNRFVNISLDTPYDKAEYIDNNELILRGTLYNLFSLDWSYYTDLILNEQSIPVNWAIRRIIDGNTEYEQISTVTGIKNRVSTFTFIPENSISSSENAYLVALYNNNEIDSWPIVIEKNSLTLSETTGYDLKLSAYGRSNTSPTRDIWRDETHNIGVTFSKGVTWDSTSGWDEHSFMAIGEEAYANIEYVPFPNNFGPSGRTIEIEFKSEQVNDDNDILIDIGSPTAGRITITPVKATIWVNGAEVISTHYKANERIKLAFIFNKTEGSIDSLDNNLVFIVNNGILERAAGLGNTNSYTNNNGIFKLGGSLSGIRVYTIRAYPIAISYSEEYNNFVYDSDDKFAIANRNDILSGGAIIYDECVKKIDTILIEGDMSKLLNRNITNKKDSETTVNIIRTSVSDTSKDFTVYNGKIRKHGQSTLNYPITSLKVWFNKSATNDVNPTIKLSSLLTAMGLNKNRYLMKDGSIPANKFVLLANYADSSGANNGAIERLIQDTWYNAKIDGEYKLRTAPQLFSTGELVNHNDPEFNEIGENAWIEGYGTDTAEGKTWKDIANKPFPYKIRNSADSFPCAVFYRNTTGTDTSYHFLGQYVFMDDKKSDYLYGERSIYHYYDETDPFCLKTENKDEDTKANRVWNNNKVVRIEVVLLDTILTSYMNYNVPASASDSVNKGSIPCDSIKYDNKGNALNFYWEDYFEMIYPDPDDFEIKVNGTKVAEDKFAENSLFREKALYFLNFLQWITGVALKNSGTKISGTKVTQAALDEFKNTASLHVDLYKLAAYYIFFLRFGLVDSVERNAQLKTYDGLHWHYEPWDMDIAVGNKNDGGFAFEPPVNRNTTLVTDSSTYAFSGRSTTTSNVLWDCLEAWDYWKNTIVPKVALALYDAGLTYDNITQLFDEEYSNKWSEVMYNESGHYKYVQMRGTDNDWLNWLQGAAISHRHWWLSKSMNYYDAMWTVGDFNNHRVYIAVNKDIHTQGTDIITIKPTSSTFFKLTQGDGTASLGTVEATKDNPAKYDVSIYAFNKKDPTHIYGATFIEELDLSCFASKLAVLTLTGAYDNVLGAPIKKLNIGIPMTVNNGNYSGYVSGTNLAFSASDTEGHDALANIKVLDITGQQSITNTDSLLYSNNRRTLTDFYAIGTGLRNFTSSRSGNKFNELRLPAKTIKTNSATGVSTESSILDTLKFIDSSWQNISFWTTYTSDEIVIEEAAEEGDEPVVRANPATFRNTGIPATINLIELEGSTASNRCAANLVLDWLSAIEAKVASDNPTLSGTALENKLLEVLASYKLIAENISWGTQEVPVQIYYRDLARLAALNNGNNQNANLKGYIKIADREPLTSIQITQIRGWFGESVFNKSNINSGLIIDQELSERYVQVNVGKDAYIDIDPSTGEEAIFLNEGHSATLNATKFLLSEDPDVYEWSISSQTLGYSANIVEGADGITRLVVNESTVGDYILTVSARTGALIKSTDIHIIGVTYPDDWKFGVRGINGISSRKFSPSVNIASLIFGNNRIYQSGSNSVMRDIYVMYNSYQDFEFYIEAVNGEGKTATYSKTEYEVQCLDTEGNLARTNALFFKGDGSTTELIDEQYLYWNNGALHSPINGIVLSTKDKMPIDVIRYVIGARVTVGGTTETRYMNLILVLDSAPLVKANSTVLYLTLKLKIDENMNRDLYKTDLFGIDGTLTFNGTLTDMVTEPVDGRVSSIFKYLPYVNQLVLDNTIFETTDSSISETDKRILNLTNMTALTRISLDKASMTTNNTNESVIDVTNCPQLTEFISTGSIAGIKVDNNGLLTTISLGNPYIVQLKNTSSLESCTTESSANLEDVRIENVNKATVRGFNTFNTIFV